MLSKICSLLLLMVQLFAVSSAALAQGVAMPDTPATVVDPRTIEFAADDLSYSNNEQTVLAKGSVVLSRDGYALSADEIRYDRTTGIIEARGNVVARDKEGGVVRAEKMQLTDSLRDAVVDNIQLILSDGSRLAALRGQRGGGKTNVERAVYSPCIVCAQDGKERPLWRLKALKVELNEAKKRIYFDGASLDFLSVPIAYIPFLSIPSPEVSRATGFLVPQLKQARELGFAIDTPYFINLAPWRDLTVTPSIFTGERPALGAEYRERVRQGPMRIGGTLTYAPELDANNEKTGNNKFRGYVYADGRLTHNAQWRSSFDLRLTTDDTFLRRYEISNDDTLRGHYALERFGDNSYFSAELWGFQTLRDGRDQGLVPLALPVINYWWRSQPWIAGGRWTVIGNTASIIRTSGADTWRTSLGAQYDVPYVNNLGLVMKGTGYTRTDLYYQNDAQNQDTAGNFYSGKDGFEARVVGALAGEVRLPMGKPGFGGFQTLEPVVQIVAASRDTRLNEIANEDSRAIDLDESNLLSLNRFTGFDRWDGGLRLTYAVRYNVDRKGLAFSTEIGQSYRFNSQAAIFPKGTGLSDQLSDIVGRTSVRIGDKIDIVHRFRLDKKTFAIRRNEIDAVVGAKSWQLSLGYSNLNRGIAIEGLEDREEIRAAARVKLTRHWSLVASSIYDVGNNFAPIRNSIGGIYEDECFTFGLTWRKNYTEDRDFRRGSTILFNIALKTLGGRGR
jgi:LPS-assembly protein